MDVYMEFWRRYFDFKGVTSRKDYWMTVLINMIILFVISYLGTMLSHALVSTSDSLSTAVAAIVGIIIPAAFFIPSIAITVRRLHDTNKSGWWMLLNFIGIGVLIVLILTLMDSKHDNNKWV